MLFTCALITHGHNQRVFTSSATNEQILFSRNYSEKPVLLMLRLKIADQTLKHEIFGPEPVCTNDFFMGNKNTPEMLPEVFPPEMLPEVSQLDQ